MAPRAAVDADWVPWLAGTALGLVTACWIPYLMMTRHVIAADGAFGGWLMPVVPATGACDDLQFPPFKVIKRGLSPGLPTHCPSGRDRHRRKGRGPN
jgi:hypothetical protein